MYLSSELLILVYLLVNSHKSFTKLPFNISLAFSFNSLVFLFALVVVSNLLFYLMPSEDLYIRLLSQVIFVGGVILIVWFKDIGNIREFIKARLNK